MPAKDGDDAAFMDSEYEHTLAYFTWLQRRAVRGQDGRYIDPPAAVTDSTANPDLQNAEDMIDASWVEVSSSNLCEDDSNSHMQESALTLASEGE
ncbi:hypothetical protein SARC_07752 [Sphaeroforma arctica JP610]|uniref:Uncharacterized protein n=1 Tax=Sphaeroforma arctica JP610 TaxID=667725 RepID=A0A0L0FST3_9EUKA|nr:hypothetical protein SARC_07752 [Sphaeroforma arctica JP610]KNC79867.1 hypothetical protein SARC_07752 [Sphaeroforma arctica JP610]|eukprot:XP_014153769.1 hypothetical protein SARC_07752 [Sphaeroforma arctica JP610]